MTCEGIGLHSGARVRLEVEPAGVDHGIAFLRTDRPESRPIPARVEWVVDTTLSTTIGRDGLKVGTIEHLLAALWGMGVTNALVRVDGPELPILDGSALPYVEAIREAGRVSQGVERRGAELDRSVEVEHGDRSLLFQPGSAREVTCVVDYGHPHAGPQLFEGRIDEATFVSEIAPARTFCLYSDVEAMRRAGLVKGGSLENAVVIGDDGPMTPLRFPDECVRHKVLDLVGDLALCGFDWQGSVVAAKAGHPLHVELARRLTALARPTERTPHAISGR
jgi:UDP-3-O-[3-hydroxymyristoyl] N-acetylglucosamine deacetylase